MEEVLETMQLQDMQCDVCGEKTFQEREGFYYCVECGTQKDQIRAVDLTAEDNFNDTTKYASRTIRRPKEVPKNVDNDPTSWEFYNYVLRGFLQELLNMGAKPELKLMTLQVWAAYMGRMEVAFCRGNESGKPKLNVRALLRWVNDSRDHLPGINSATLSLTDSFSCRDARLIYKYKPPKVKKGKKQNQSGDPNDERAKFRLWNRTKVLECSTNQFY